MRSLIAQPLQLNAIANLRKVSESELDAIVITRDLFISHPTSVPLIDRDHSLPTRGSGHGLVSVGGVGNKQKDEKNNN